MNGIKPWAEAYIDINLALVMTLGLWLVVRAVLARTRWAGAYGTQRTLLGVLLLSVLASPWLVAASAQATQVLWPQHSLALSDLAVAAFLDGRIAMPAMAFADLLALPNQWLDAFLSASSFGWQLVWGVLAVGLCVAVGRLGVAALSVRRNLARAYLLRRTRGVHILISQEDVMPFAVRGLRRAYVVVPSSLILQPRNLRLVLAHEFQHIRRGDTELELLAEAMRVFFFWNPAFLIWKRQLEQVRELSCDQIVMGRANSCPQAYARCLVDLCETGVSRRGPGQLNVGLMRPGRAKRDLVHRIQVLCLPSSDTKAQMPLVAGLALALALFVAVTFGAAAFQSTQDWSHDRLMLSTLVNLERLEMINAGFTR